MASVLKSKMFMFLGLGPVFMVWVLL